MRKLLVASVAAAALVVPVAPAQASCGTELGDTCKLMDFVCTTTVGQKLLAYCDSIRGPTPPGREGFPESCHSPALG